MRAKSDDDEASAGGLTAVVDGDDEHRRFWLAFDAVVGTWRGGHTAPASGILPVVDGAIAIGPAGITLKTSNGLEIGRVQGFTRLTRPGDTGVGSLENPPHTFDWTAVR